MSPTVVCLLLGHRLVGPLELVLGIEVRRCGRCGKVA
jgi:hypothetical protein